MAAVFSPRANLIMRAILIVLILFPVAGAAGWYTWFHSPYQTDVGWAVPQVVPFSHAHHVGGLGIDCRYCHKTAEESAFAGIPATDTCMHCHWQIWTEAPMLEPLRESWRTGRRLEWQRVHRLPDYVFFDHSIHVNKGIGCTTCHGAVDEMPLMRKTETLFMGWCLDCHRDPAPHIRPREEVYNVDYDPPADPRVQGNRLMQEYSIDTVGLTNCTTCHR
jgi:hypothetical protein